ncbi:hypothetical protein [uncultured Helicobacter sp.]|uniref:hypothetical protein n=1 Tax=uncultured Helicobacter sp. TaxID=175537 RepID=UPI00272C5667|nr:hypothetical protein [uncultured Helicobacter sp.]
MSLRKCTIALTSFWYAFWRLIIAGCKEGVAFLTLPKESIALQLLNMLCYTHCRASLEA